MGLKLISYGLGNTFDISKFKPVKNTYFSKPNGGLWASPVDSEWGWKEYYLKYINERRGLSSSFEFELDGNIFVIDGYVDFLSLPFISHPEYEPLKHLDFEKIRESHDAIHLTLKGLHETQYKVHGLWGWDCECVLVMNPECVRI